ncbi:alpha/beta fold hydrolase [Parahaliea maris]|uniref:Alpha/beta fold hydrolase n=1 Tax=Parahaliea maris TaxID=2716870 RepID=A0A5C8ZWW1_9GAMM|nr:alpha/beta fold hydrolase [Parahaliea maris]TXS92102.1 alpha/beta fold hydrolase [Parahaliea maris]
MNLLPSPPPLGLTLSELPRATLESLRLVSSLARLIRDHSGGDGHPVLVLPGYGAADGSTASLRYFLKRIGYRPFALAAGRNVESVEDQIKSVDDASRFRERLVELTVERIREIHATTGESVSLLGWSMGGLYALDASRQLPHITRRVITLGSPFGDPRGTSLFKLMRRLSGSTVPIETQDFDSWLAKAAAPVVPTCVIYSDRDGIVGTDIARLPESPLAQHVQVDSSHLAFALNARALEAVAVALRTGHTH